jgi:hypothetical protein
MSERALRELAVTLVAVLRTAPRTSLSADQRRSVQQSALSDSRGASARIGALARHRIARHVGDRWQQFAVWRELHPQVSYTFGLAMILVVLRIIASVG